MAMIECTIDSVRRTRLKYKWVLFLQEKDKKDFLPIYTSHNQADMVKRELAHEHFPRYFYEYEQKNYENFLAGADIFMYSLKSIVISSQDLNYRAKLLLEENENQFKIN